MNVDLFWPVFAGVICGNLLTVSFVWGLVQYSKHEREGTAGQKGTGVYVVGLVMPLVFAAAGLMIATDKVPAWLNAALQ